MSLPSVPNVYVVDDETIIAQTLAAILTTSGYSAIAFTNPLDALRSADSRPPALLISDVAMPEMNGVELAVQLKSRHPQCKVLLFSGQAATSDLLQSAQQDGHDFVLLQKPLHPRDLLSAMKLLYA